MVLLPNTQPTNVFSAASAPLMFTVMYVASAASVACCGPAKCTFSNALRPPVIVTAIRFVALPRPWLMYRLLNKHPSPDTVMSGLKLAECPILARCAIRLGDPTPTKCVSDLDQVRVAARFIML